MSSSFFKINAYFALNLWVSVPPVGKLLNQHQYCHLLGGGGYCSAQQTFYPFPNPLPTTSRLPLLLEEW